MRILAVIPARGGSKGIPKKNIVDLNGKPLIAYTIEQALLCKDEIFQVIVSTDSEEIAEVSRFYGADVPFSRPVELATDQATSLSVMQHAVRKVEQAENIKIDWSILIQATNPLVLCEDIKEVICLASSSADATSVVSVCDAMESHPIKLRVIKDGFLLPYLENTPETMRRQEFAPHVYKRNGSLYMTRRDTLFNDNDLYGDKILPYLMPPERAVDIDTKQDLEFAAFLLRQRSGS